MHARRDIRNGRSNLVSSAVIQFFITWRSDVAKPPIAEGPVTHSFNTSSAIWRMVSGSMLKVLGNRGPATSIWIIHVPEEYLASSAIDKKLGSETDHRIYSKVRRVVPHHCGHRMRHRRSPSQEGQWHGRSHRVGEKIRRTLDSTSTLRDPEDWMRDYDSPKSKARR